MAWYNLCMKTLEFHNQTWEYVKDRTLERGQVFRLADGSQYLRTGNQAQIAEEAAFARHVQASGFPVPEVLEEGTLPDGTAYYTEKSLGGETFGVQFYHEHKQHKQVSDETFNRYIATSVRFLRAQLDPQNHLKGPSELREGSNIENVLEENPDIDSGRLEAAFRKTTIRLGRLPLVLSHGDFGPFNILANGVIDFEHKFTAPVGFDVLTNVFAGRFWNFEKNGQHMLAFDFSEEQIARYLSAIDEAATALDVEQLSQYTDDMLLLKAIWSLSYEKRAAELHGTGPEKWQWRKGTLEYCLDRYLAGEPIDTTTFRHN